MATARNRVVASAIDGSAGFVEQSAVTTSYGTFTIGSSGRWTYRLNDGNADVQGLNVGDTLHDVITITTSGGTSTSVDVTIRGANDAAVITGTARDTVIEKGGVANGTPGDATAGGNLDATDVDSAATFVTQTNVAKSYGTFSIDATGVWSYTLDDGKAAVQALNRGDRLHELVTVETADGTSKVVDVTIEGANDAATITGVATDRVREKGGVANGTIGAANASGNLNATDVDNAATFVVQASVAKSYGTFSIDATGAWTYTLDDNNAAVQALNHGDTLHELVTVKTADGTSAVVDVSIEGANDAAVISGTSADRVREKGGVANGTAGAADASGNLNARDVDSAPTFEVQTNVAADYGTFSIDATGLWTYTLDDNNADVQELNRSEELHELVTVKTADGTSKVVDVTIEGANDAASISGTVAGSTTEAGGIDNAIPGVATATGDLNATDVDSAATFVAQTDVATAYGTFSIDATGAWTYTLDDGNADVEALGSGGTLHDLVTVRTADGTRQQIDITINGASADGFDLTYLTPALGFVIQGDGTGDNAGRHVSSAGDVNGDGFADLIVGAPSGDDGGNNAGEAYVVFGKASGFGTVDGTGRAVIDLSDLAPEDGFILQGATDDYAGYGVSSAGDVNGDGFADLIVGAPFGSAGGSVTGQAYVVFGRASGFGTVDGTGRAVIDLADLAPADGFVVQGDGTNDSAGWSVSSAGDVNGDGFADLIVGAVEGDDGGSNAGEAYVVFGGASGFGTTVYGRSVIDLADLAPADGFVIQGDAAGDTAGRSVSLAGDVNGDGFADLIVGARYGDDGGDDAGEAYVVFGKASGFGTTTGGRAVVDLTSLSPADGFIVQGDAASDSAGVSVSSAGDVNGDGFGDLIVGAPLGDDGGNAAGEAYVVFGKASGFGSVDGTTRAVIDLATLSPADGFIIQGGAATDIAGVSVSSAGDFNGDGFGDLIVGAPYGAAGGSQAGQAYVVFGKVSGFGTTVSGRAVLDLTDLSPDDGLIIQGDTAEDVAGFSVSAAGDVNGDGFADLIVGAPFGNDGGSDTGEAYVLLGSALGGSTTPVTTTGTSGAEMLIGGRGDDTLSGGGGADSIRGGAGDDVLSVGDLTFRSVDGGGGLDTLGLAGSGLTLDLTDRTQAAKVTGIEAIDLAGTGNNILTIDRLAVLNEAGADADGVHILTVKGNAGDTVSFVDVQWANVGSIVDGGITYDRYVDGNAEVRVAQDVTVSFPHPFDLTFLRPSQGFIIQGDVADDWAGYSVSSAGDVNGDGFADLIVGARFGDDGGTNASEAYVVFGKASGFGAVDGTGRAVIDLTTLAPADGFIVQGDAAGDYAGNAVSSAGDINGDGFADLIVGAHFGDDGGDASGEAYVVFGKASGFGTADGTGRSVIDLTDLAPADGFIVQGDAANDLAGWSVSSAGDVNGDGFADLIVGAWLGNGGGVVRAGDAYVVFGTASGFGTVDGTGRAIIDSTDLAPADGFIVHGDASGDQAGIGISSAGDVNGDGFADLIVGADMGDDGGTDNGEAYVVFGKASGFGTTVSGRSVLDLATLSPSNGFILQGDTRDLLGRFVSSAGDVNGDGFADLILGAPEGANYTGQTYVVFGKASGFGTVDGMGRAVIDLADLAPADGFLVKGANFVGFSVSEAGDVNGDGFADLIMGSLAGKAYVVFGKASGFGTVDGNGRAVLNLTNLSPADGFFVEGDAAGDQAGFSVSAAGDVNGDGFADLIVGAPTGDDGGTNAGEAYVVFGGAFGGSTAPVTTNGTGGAEILIGGLGDDTLSGGGGADSIRGGAGDDALSVGDLGFLSVDGGGGIDTLALAGSGLTLDLTDRTLAAKIVGIEAIDLTGTGDNTVTLDRLAVLNEVGANQDGVHVLTIKGNAGDVVSFVEAQWANAGTIADGGVTYDRYVDGDAEVRIDHGVAVTFPEPFDLTFLRPSQGFIIQGDAAGDLAGISVSSAGDINGDGFADLIVGAKYGDYAGEAYVVFGGASGFGTVDGAGRAVIDLTGLAPGDGFIIQGDAAFDYAGFSVSSAGDVNGDGFADLIVGARGNDDGGSDAGEAYVVFGKASGFGTMVSGRAVIDLADLAPADGFIVQGDTAVDRTGWTVSSAGDVNGDGFADLIVGAVEGDDGGSAAGEAYVVFGKASGFGTTVSGRSVIDLTTLAPTDGFIVQGDAAADTAGRSVSSAGDVNGDGFADLVVGATGGDDGGDYAGEAYVVFGKASGFGTTDGAGRAVIDLTSLSPTDGFIIQGDAPGDWTGHSVSSAGDVNGDGFADLIVGARYGDDGGNDAGEAYVVFGRASGFGTTDGAGRAVIDLTTLAPTDGFIVQGDLAADNAGFSVSSAGDVNGDGFADLIVGGVNGDDGGLNAGEAYVVFGKASGVGTTVSGRSVIDLADLAPGDGFIVQGDLAYDNAGWSVSSAGDVNGDGFADLIVGAPSGDDGGTDAGEAYVLFGGAFGGSTAPVTTTGSSAAEILIGGLGDDTLTGGGGADSIRGGAGDDRLSVPDLAFRNIDGGGGSDTLVLLGSGQDFDFTALADDKASSIETIDITGTGDNGLTLGFADIAAMTVADNALFAAANSHHALVVDGNSGDTLDLRDYDPDGVGGLATALWTQVATGVGLDGSAGGAYNVFDLVRGGDVLATVAMDADITRIS